MNARFKIASNIFITVAAVIFCINFVWIKFSRVNVDELYKPSVGRVVIMVIDALRWDFVEGAEGQLNMPYTASLVAGKKACLLTGKARPPTVTMPRIKVGSTFLTLIDIHSKMDHVNILQGCRMQ